MNFSNKSEFDEFSKSLTFLASGSQGECFLDNKKKIVYKIFFDCFDENYFCYYNKDDILRFNHIKNKTFIWPKKLITCNNKIIGYTSSYKKAINLYKLDPLSIDLINLEKAVKKVYLDLKLLDDNNVVIYDIMYNLLYNNSNLYAIDNTEYSIGSNTCDNYNIFAKSVIYFLIDGYFNTYISNNKILNDMLNTIDINLLDFLKEFRLRLSIDLDKNINKLHEARKLIKKTYPKYYIREMR